MLRLVDVLRFIFELKNIDITKKKEIALSQINLFLSSLDLGELIGLEELINFNIKSGFDSLSSEFRKEFTFWSVLIFKFLNTFKFKANFGKYVFSRDSSIFISRISYLINTKELWENIYNEGRRSVKLTIGIFLLASFFFAFSSSISEFLLNTSLCFLVTFILIYQIISINIKNTSDNINSLGKDIIFIFDFIGIDAFKSLVTSNIEEKRRGHD